MLHVCPATDTGFTPWSVQQGIFSPVSALSADALTSVHIQTQKGSNECLFNTDTQYADFWGNPLYQATKISAQVFI